MRGKEGEDEALFWNRHDGTAARRQKTDLWSELIMTRTHIEPIWVTQLALAKCIFLHRHRLPLAEPLCQSAGMRGLVEL